MILYVKPCHHIFYKLCNNRDNIILRFKENRFIRRGCKYDVCFMRNNVIIDTLEKLTNTPFIFEDDTTDVNLIARNREIASLYALLIIACMLYIYITEVLEDQEKHT